MFIESITAPRNDWEEWDERLRLASAPPEALVARVAWESSEGIITSVHVWDSPSAVAEFFVERVLPIVEAEGEPEKKPQRHGEPIATYFRPSV